VNRILLEQANKLTHFFVNRSYWQGMPEDDLEDRLSSVRLFLNESTFRFRFIYQVCIAFLHLVSIFLKGRTFNKLSDSHKGELMDRLLVSRKRLICSVSVILSLPYLKSFKGR